jgi:hypothetical protein
MMLMLSHSCTCSLALSELHPLCPSGTLHRRRIRSTMSYPFLAASLNCSLTEAVVMPRLCCQCMLGGYRGLDADLPRRSTGPNSISGRMESIGCTQCHQMQHLQDNARTWYNGHRAGIAGQTSYADRPCRYLTPVYCDLSGMKLPDVPPVLSHLAHGVRIRLCLDHKRQGLEMLNLRCTGCRWL